MFLFLLLILVGLAWSKPWNDSAFVVKITVATDEDATVGRHLPIPPGGVGKPRPTVVYQTRKLFSENDKGYPLATTEVDLSPWAGQLIRLDFGGEVKRRGTPGTTGYVACAAELVTPDGTLPLEFKSWQQGQDLGAHTRPLGSLECRVIEEGKDRFAFSLKGSLWYCLKTPKSARLRVRLRPVVATNMTGLPEIYVPTQFEEAVTPELPPRKPNHPPDVFIYVIDALRADHVGCYGYPRGTTPNLDAFAAKATLYQSAYTTSTWTRPSVAAMLTSLYPSVHGAIHGSDGLAQWPVLLPEMLQQDGYRTRCFITNPHLSVPFGMDQGYDEYIYYPATADWVNNMVGQRLATEDPAQPVFMYLQTVEPHNPYAPRADSFARFDRGIRGKRCEGKHGGHECMGELSPIRPGLSKQDIEHLLDLYDAEIYEADKAFADFLVALKKAGRYENALIIVTADHGEAFAEHDTMFHDWSLNQETMRVPLLIHFPGGARAGEKVEQRVSLLDLTPTVLAQIGLRPKLPYRLAGRDISREVVGRHLPMPPGGVGRPRPTDGRRIYAEVSQWDNNEVDLVAVIDEDGYKRVIDVSVPPRERASPQTLGLWDTKTDPKETTDLSGKLPVRAAYDEQLLASWLLQQRFWRGLPAPSRAPEVHYDEVVEKQLRALGYVGGREEGKSEK